MPSECLADLTRGAHADLAITGTVGVVGRMWTVNLILVESAGSKVRNRASVVVESPKQLPHAVRTAVDTLMRWGAQQQSTFRLAEGQTTSLAVLDLAPSGVAEQVATNLTHRRSTCC